MGIIEFHSKQPDLVLREIETALEGTLDVLPARVAGNRPRASNTCFDQDAAGYLELLEILCSQDVQA